MKIVLAQLNPVVGDIDGNLDRVIETLEKYRHEEPDLLVFSELFLIGYPPRDLLERPWFIDKVGRALDKLKAASREYPKIGILLGAPQPTGLTFGKALYNSAILIFQGEILFRQHKSLLPTYDVFDEPRYFEPASEICTVAFKGEVLGVSICEDAWNDSQLWETRPYCYDPVEELVKQGATLLINISASPFELGKDELRFRIIQSHIQKHRIPFLYVNQIGGNDELIFDGRSMFIDEAGNPAAVLKAFQEEVRIIQTQRPGTPDLFIPAEKTSSLYDGLTLGIRDYLHKCGFSKAVLGLSGGIDSAVTCCLAVNALGAGNVMGISMPSPYSSAGSVEDSRKLAENLGIDFKVIPISEVYERYLDTFQTHFRGVKPDVTEENIQARIRGNILMAVSNKFGCLLLSTGNKSELAVGYCTLYGDMSGGLSVISDVPKTMVYDLARYINRANEIIPHETIEKPPSAELKPNQLDQDTLPPYDVLDGILSLYLDHAHSQQEIIGRDYDPEMVKWVIKNVDRNEYKRRQAAPGLKVTSKAFGVGRRMPVAANYSE